MLSMISDVCVYLQRAPAGISFTGRKMKIASTASSGGRGHC